MPTLKEVMLLQAKGSGSMDCIDLADTASHYSVETIDISSLRSLDGVNLTQLTLATWYELFAKYVIDGSDDLEGKAVIRRLIELVEKGVELSPVVLDNDGYLLDGYHRIAAYNELGITKIKVFIPVN